VIILVEDYAHNGNVSDEHINNHYVACTRAKTKLIIIDSDSQDAKAMKQKPGELFKAASIKSNQLISVSKSE